MQSNSGSTIAATGTLSLPLTTFSGSLTFDPITYSIFGTPVNVSSAIGGNPMTAAFSLIGATVGGLDLGLSRPLLPFRRSP